MRIYELKPNNGRKSFYGKAQVIIDETGAETLTSYGTPIIRRENCRLIRLYDGWTDTTGKHIISFCGLKKADFMALPLARED